MRCERAFILVEVLVFSVLAGIVLSAAFAVSSTSAKAMARAEEKYTRAIELSNMLADIRTSSHIGTREAGGIRVSQSGGGGYLAPIEITASGVRVNGARGKTITWRMRRIHNGK